ncbi:MAG: hypothetical protein ACYTGB_15290 [Planctomycetota bacterium]|jgi:anti-anti-sigma regulatory factor
MAKTSFPIAFSPDGRRAIMQVETEVLGLQALQEFEETSRKLLDSGRAELVVDMGTLNRIHSGYIGVILYASAEALEKGLEFSVNARRKVMETFNQIAPGLVRFTEAR